MKARAHRALHACVTRVRRELVAEKSTIVFPAMPHLTLPSVPFTFDFCKGTTLHGSVSDGRWRYEPDVMATLLTCLAATPGATFVDIGANVGYFPLVLKGLLGANVHCIAYEPTPYLVAVLHRGARANGVEIDIRSDAVADRVGTARLYLSARSDTSNSLDADFRQHHGEIDVQVTTVDDDILPLMPDVGARPVLLVDTETTEPAVLDGARNFISKHRPAIICEVLAGRTEEQLQAFVDSIDYATYCFTDHGVSLRSRIVGDETYEHRDWLFWPAESTPPVNEISETLRVLVETEHPSLAARLRRRMP